MTGASGCGTTTLGRALASRLGIAFLDADDFFWEQTVPPYQRKRTRTERLALILSRIQEESAFVLAGSISGWGAELETLFELVIFLSVPTEVRLMRLEERELKHLGRVDPEFIAWAAQYDSGGLDMRSRALHEHWLAHLNCTVLRLDGERPTGELVEQVLSTGAEQSPAGDVPKAAPEENRG